MAHSVNQFDEKVVTLANGLSGEIVNLPSANPATFFAAISRRDSVEAHNIAGQLFCPDENQNRKKPAVIIVPGSLSVAPSHLQHAAALTDLGLAVLVIDPFVTRQVTSTVANQAQYSFAASTWDVMASVAWLGQRAEIDEHRIGAQGHSRGGSAVVNAAVTTFAAGFNCAPLRAVYAAYPWCGFQFLEPKIGSTVVRSIIGDQDEWCLPQQVQSAMHAMQLAGGTTSCRIVPGAHHSFDRDTELELVPDASVAPAAPTTYLSHDGRYVHPVTGPCAADTTERDLMLYGIKSGYGRRGAHIGTIDSQAALFHEDMTSFWLEQLQPQS